MARLPISPYLCTDKYVNITLRHYRLPSVTTNVTRERY
jgi:hypothetical protein